MARTKGLHPNLNAFLDMLALSEGTKGNGDDGYNVVVGGSLFDGYDEHPGIRVWLPKYQIYSTAAGRYQILQKYAKAYISSLKLKDFGPESQDAIAIKMIKEQKAFDDVIAGRISQAINKCNNIWASLPGAGYKQHEQKESYLISKYRIFGGTMEVA